MADDYTKDAENFRQEYDRIHNRWVQSTFYTSRETWDSVDNRAYKIPLDDFLETYRAGINILTPFIEKARDQHVMTMTLDSPRLDVIPLETNEDGKKKAESARIWHASVIREQDEGLRITKPVSQSLVQYGVAIVREDWEAPREPDEGYYRGKLGDDYYDPASDDGNEERTKKRTKAREDYYHEKAKHKPFSKVVVSPFEMCWDSLDDPGLIFQRSVIPYSDAKDRLRTLNGKKLRISELGKIVLLGDEEPDPEDRSSNVQSADDKQIEVIRKAYKDPESGKWYCCEYVCIEGAAWTEAEKLNEYPCPLGRAPYLIVESAGGDKLSNDPHLRYRPMMYPLYVLGAELNFYRTMMAVIGRMKMDGRLVYLDTTKATDAQLAALEQPGVMVDGTGASQPVVWKKIDAAGTEVVALPGSMQAWPWNSIEELQMLIETTDRDFWNEMPKRNLAAQYGEAKEPETLGQQIDDRQALAIPYSNELQGVAVMWEQACEAERCAIIEWDQESEPGAQRLYATRTTGKEPVLKNPVDAGREIEISAETLKVDYDIVVVINNETQAERIQKDLAADDAYLNKKALTREQWLERRGFENPLQQIKELEKDRARERYELEMEPVRTAMAKSYASILMGVDLNQPMPPMRADMVGGSGQPQASPMQARPTGTAPVYDRPSAESAPSGMPM